MFRGIKTNGLQHSPGSSIVYGTSDGTNIALESTSIAFVADGQKTKRCESEYKMETLKGTFGFAQGFGSYFAACFSPSALVERGCHVSGQHLFVQQNSHSAQDGQWTCDNTSCAGHQNLPREVCLAGACGPL